MIKEKTLAYLARDRAVYKPTSRFQNPHWEKKKAPWDEVAFLWGDAFYIESIVGEKAHVSAKGHHFEIDKQDLMETGVLQIYQIDCGQGDAALVQFPDFRWMLIDGGPPREGNWTNTGKIAWDFIKWKMYVDSSWRHEFNYDPWEGKVKAKPTPFHIDSIVLTHPDHDHYGGLLELEGKLKERDDFERVTVGTIYHDGLGRFAKPFQDFKNGAGRGQLGRVAGSESPHLFQIDLFDTFDELADYADGKDGLPKLDSGAYSTWLRQMLRWRGKGIDRLCRLHHAFPGGHVPGYAPGIGDVAVKVLGPVQESWNGAPALRMLDSKGSIDSPSKTRNGQSIVLRFDYDEARLLWTGDLNFRSHALLLEHVAATEFQADVVKACHHGSEDVSWTFLQATNPVATIVSSGDNESHVHPRAKAMGWLGHFAQPMPTGGTKKYLNLRERNYRSPAIYSTELARSTRLWDAHKVYGKIGDVEGEVNEPELQGRGRSLDDPDSGPREPLKKWLLADRLVYGLINVRTDGKKILIGVMKEGEVGFHTDCFDVD